MRAEVDHLYRGKFKRYRELVETLLHPSFPIDMNLSQVDLPYADFNGRGEWVPP